MKCVMKLIEMYAKSEELYEDDPGKWTQKYTTTRWAAVGDKYVQSKFNINRKTEMSLKPLYNKMVKIKAFNNGNKDGLVNV